MKKISVLLTAFTLLSLAQVNKVSASHTAGMDIFYRHTIDSTYQFTVIFYRNCQGITQGADASVNVRYVAPSIGFTGALTFNCPMLPTGGPGVPPIQPPNLLSCTDASSLCYEEYVYRGNWTSPRRATDWKFSWELCCRPNTPAATNMAANIQYIECGLNNKDFPDKKAKNWSPFWHNRRPNHPGHLTDTVINYLFRTMCQGNYYTLELDVTEYQGDSVTYGFYWPQDGGGANLAYINGWSFANPLPTLNGPLTINPTTGVMPVVPGAPTGTGVYVLGVEAKEWRYDTIVSGGSFVRVAKQIGYVRRDMTIWIDNLTTCRRDSVHPKDVTISNGGGDTVLNVFFHTGKVGDQDSRVRCETLSPDGSEFRLLDSSNYVAPFDTTVRSIGINRAVWNCQSGLTNKVTLHLAEKLRCQVYTIMLKIGSDLDVLESECGFLEPQFATGKLTVTKNVKVSIDTVPTILSYCLPTTDPFPKLTASSTDISSFPLSYYWAYNPDPNSPLNGDTIDGQKVPYTWANQTGKYTVLVRDPLNCAGKDAIKVYFDSKPSFVFDVQPYCDKFGEQPGLPEYIVAPQDSDITKWEWRSSLGLMGEGDTLKSPQLITDMFYTLRGFKKPIANGIPQGCRYDYSFYYGRDSFPPQSPLWVDFVEDYVQICLTYGDTAVLQVWEDGMRDKFKPLNTQWFLNGFPIPGQDLSRVVTDIGFYRVNVTDSLGCWGEDTAVVTFDLQLPAPVITCTVDRNGVGTFTMVWEDPNHTSRLVGYEVSTDGYTWWPTNNGSIHTVNNVQEVKFLYGRGLVPTACGITRDSLSAECPDQVFPPNIITPNGDGLNDVFDVTGLQLFDGSILEVFDRWGNLVYKSSNYKNDWNGGDLPEGTYFYVLNVDDPQATVHKGVITLLR